MTHRDELAVAYADARLWVLRVKRERRSLLCTTPQDAGDDYLGDPVAGIPCWQAWANPLPDSPRLNVTGWCENCVKSQTIHVDLRVALRAEASALRKLKRADKAAR